MRRAKDKVSGHTSNAQCNACGPEAPIVDRPLAPYPVWSQLIFGVSFLLFWWIAPRPNWIKALWTGLQILLGVWLFWGRIQAKKRVFRCARCGATVA